MKNRLTDLAFALPQYLLPHHALSRLMQRLSYCRNSRFRKLFIGWFIRRYQVNLMEAERERIDQYQSFNDFFTRALKADARPLQTGPNAVLSPADGVISQRGNIENEQLIQAKGQYYSLTNLLGGDSQLAADFRDGKFATIYLSPRDYHRLHMPVAGTLRRMIYIPGRLFSVNEATTRVVPGLFGRNERVVAVFDTDIGPMALVLVGALFVASIETVWHGVVTPPHGSHTSDQAYTGESAASLAAGEEMGRFNMGSTIIVLFGKQQMAWLDSIEEGSSIRMGEQMGTGSS